MKMTNHPRHVLLIGPPGSGKTTLLIEELIHIIRADAKGKAIYLGPTRALMNEILGRVESQVGQGKAILSNRDFPISVREMMPYRLIITSPYRLLTLMSSERFPELMRDVRLIALDEAHEVFTYGEKAIGRVLIPLLSMLAKEFGDFRLLLASATMAPELVMALTSSIPGLKIQELDVQRDVALVGYMYQYRDDRQRFYRHEFQYVFGEPKPILFPERLALSKNGFVNVVVNLADLVAQNLGKPIRTLVHVPFRRMADEYGKMFREEGKKVYVHHGSTPADERKRIESAISENAKENEFIVSCLTLSEGVNVRDLHLLVIHPAAFHYRDIEAQEEEGNVKDDIFSFWLSPITFLQMQGRVGRKELSDHGYVVVFIEDEKTLDIWRPVFQSGVVPFHLNPITDYYCHSAILFLATHHGVLSEEKINEFILRTPDYHVALNKDDVVQKFYNATLQTRDILLHYGLARVDDNRLVLTRAGQALARSAMPLPETLIIRDVLDLGFDELIKRILNVQADMGKESWLTDEEIRVLATAGLLSYQVSQRLASVAEGVHRSLQMMLATARRLKSLPPWEYRTLFDPDTLDRIIERLAKHVQDFVTGPSDLFRKIYQELGRRDRVVPGHLARLVGIDQFVRAYDLFPDLSVGLVPRDSILRHRLNAIAKLVRDREAQFDPGSIYSDLNKDVVSRLIELLEQNPELSPEIVYPFIPVFQVIQAPDQVLEQLQKALFQRYPDSVVVVSPENIALEAYPLREDLTVTGFQFTTEMGSYLLPVAIDPIRYNPKQASLDRAPSLARRIDFLSGFPVRRSIPRLQRDTLLPFEGVILLRHWRKGEEPPTLKQATIFWYVPSVSLIDTLPDFVAYAKKVLGFCSRYEQLIMLSGRK